MRSELTGIYDVRTALARLGMGTYEERDGELWARCPGHIERTGAEDRSPSWSVNVETGMHHCFSCGFGGTLPMLVSTVLHVNYVQAEGWLADPGLLAAAIEARLRTVQRSAYKHAEKAPVDLSGFTLPPPHALDERRITMEAAVRFEILWDGKGFILPIRDAAHNLLGYQIKHGSFVRNRPRGVAKGTTLFGLGAFRGPEAVLVESPLDAARLWTCGIDGGMASFGAEVSDEQIELLVRISQRLIIALDDDNAGEIGADKVENAVNSRISPVRRFAYPRPRLRGVKDPGDLADQRVHEGIENAATRLQRLTATSGRYAR